MKDLSVLSPASLPPRRPANGILEGRVGALAAIHAGSQPGIFFVDVPLLLSDTHASKIVEGVREELGRLLQLVGRLLKLKNQNHCSPQGVGDRERNFAVPGQIKQTLCHPGPFWGPASLLGTRRGCI